MSELRVLVVRYRAIGDCVMAAWCVTGVRRAIPNAQIVWAVETRCAEVVDSRRLVNQVCEVPRDRWRAQAWRPSSWREQVRYHLKLREQRFDLGFDLQGHSKTAILLRLSGARRRASMPGTDALARRLNPQVAVPEAAHQVERMAAVVQSEIEFELPEFPILPVRPQRPLTGSVTISVGAGHPSKVYAHWDSVARRLLAEGVQVTCLGGPGDTCPPIEGAENAVGRLSLTQTMERITGSEVHVAGDTGTGHMAAALAVPVVSVFGPMPAARYRPYTCCGTVLERNGDPNQVSPEEVVAAVARWRRL
jgi:ADP-heptose:LPS heptosyltransferase